jgi:CubicO group peptidase (beta-lactamase class C family)
MTSRRNFMKQAGLATTALLAPHLSLNAFAKSEDKRFQALRKAISAQASLLKIPGLAVAVVEEGHVSFVQTEGFADIEKKIPVQRDHIFPVASLTKTFAAVTLMLYEQEGKISMDDYILDYPFLSVGLTPDRLYNPNLKIKHVLSHTSEGEPGSNYIYNGNRYSFVYGVFEKMSGNTKHYEAFAEEVTKKIIRPLNMIGTLPGYPSDKDNPAIPRIVTTYSWDGEHQSFNPDRGLSGATTLYPANGLLTTIDDLAAYCHALDQNTLLTAESYKKLTSPFVTTSGRQGPYGLGWSTQLVGGRQVHWHYGYGDSFAALIIRIPQEKLAFILLSNGVHASEPFVLGFGNLLNSVFAQAFFKHIVFRRNGQFSYTEITSKPSVERDALFYDELFCQALMRYYAEQNYHEHQGEAATIMQYLAQNDPERFHKIDVSLIYVLARLADPGLKVQIGSAILAYVSSGWFHPEVHDLIAGWYARDDNWQEAREWYHRLADSKGYGEQWGVKNACNVLGKYYLDHGEIEKGRYYLWREALYSCNMTPNEEVNRQLKNMKSL